MGSIYYTYTGVEIKLDKEIGRGGEGPVYSVQGRPSDVAKIYSKKLSFEDHEKLLLMINKPPTDPSYSTNKHRSIAWPSSMLYADKHKTQFAGFVMPKADLKIFKKALIYMSPNDRLEQYFGSITWQHLFFAAHNISSAVAAIHERGYCVGDINESNLLIAPDALITLIDCDSFQVKDSSSNKVYRCLVGKEDYTAPELHGRSYHDVDRTPETDNFALSVLIFQLLMEGFHPYSGRWLLSGDPPRISDKIHNGLYPYGKKLNELAPQPNAPNFEIIHPDIQRLFHRCFVDGHSRPEERPTAKEWMSVLSGLMGGFQRCSKNDNHRYLNHLSYCSWCERAKNIGEENDSFPNPAGQQIPLADPTKSLKTLDERIEYLKTYIDMALIDGILSQDEIDYIVQQGVQLQIPKNDIQKIIDKEVQQRGINRVHSSGQVTSPTLGTTPTVSQTSAVPTLSPTSVGTITPQVSQKPLRTATPSSFGGTQFPLKKIIVIGVSALIIIILLYSFWPFFKGKVDNHFSNISGDSLTKKSVIVPSNKPWTDTGIYLKSGQGIKISASGSVNGTNSERDGSWKWVGPNGWGYIPSYATNRRHLLPEGKSFMALVGKIGNGDSFLIGKSYERKITQAGNLFLGTNDVAKPEGHRWWLDNQGSFNVKIETFIKETITVDSKREWTTTGITIEKGNAVGISAHGKITWDPTLGEKGQSDPEGAPWAQVLVSRSPTQFPAPELPLASLIGRVGGGKPFLVGNYTTIRSDMAGELLLGLNDRQTKGSFEDNNGSFEVTIIVFNPESVKEVKSIQSNATGKLIPSSSTDSKRNSGLRIQDGNVKTRNKVAARSVSIVEKERALSDRKTYPLSSDHVSIKDQQTDKSLPEPSPNHLAKITIKTIPSNATIHIDKKHIGETPLTINMDFGPHGIQIQKNGYQDKFEVFRVTQNGRNEFVYELKQQ